MLASKVEKNGAMIGVNFENGKWQRRRNRGDVGGDKSGSRPLIPAAAAFL